MTDNKAKVREALAIIRRSLDDRPDTLDCGCDRCINHRAAIKAHDEALALLAAEDKPSPESAPAEHGEERVQELIKSIRYYIGERLEGYTFSKKIERETDKELAELSRCLAARPQPKEPQAEAQRLHEAGYTMQEFRQLMHVCEAPKKNCATCLLDGRDGKEGCEEYYSCVEGGASHYWRPKAEAPKEQALCNYWVKPDSELPYPRVLWESDCGFQLCVIEGYIRDRQGGITEKLNAPEGVCPKCGKKKYAVLPVPKDEIAKEGR